MAAVLKKRALAEYSQVIQEDAPIIKKVRLTRKSTYQGIDVEKLQTLPTHEALPLLVELLDNLPTDSEDVKLVYQSLLEYFRQQPAQALQARLVTLLVRLGAQLPSPEQLVEELLVCLGTERSHLLLTQILDGLLELAQSSDISRFHPRLLAVATQHLSDPDHHVQGQCLRVLSQLPSTNPAATFRILGDFGVSCDPRIRAQAFQGMLRMHQQGYQLEPELYIETCAALEDNYEGVRMAALRLVHQFAFLYPEKMVGVAKVQEKIRLVDDAFGKICQMMNDLSLQVRILAASLMGSMNHASPHFLEQTMDKQLMSNLRRKRTAHERSKDNYESGEWSTGQKWADDAPKESIDEESVSLMRSGACGAFVHGLEDEFMEVRMASLDSLCQLAVHSSSFASLALDFLVDMFNDEIEEVRLRTIRCLATVSPHVPRLREDQLDTILSVLKDFSMDIREALHTMLGVVNLSTKAGLKLCVDALLDNQKRYPQDKRSIWRCLHHLGGRHPSLVLPLVRDLMGIHPFLDLPEPDVEDPTYISMLILVLNAAHTSPTMASLFDTHIYRHYSYLRDTLPSLVPVLPQLATASPSSPAQPEEVSPDSIKFFQSVLERLRSADLKSPALRQRHMECAIKDLQNLAKIEPQLSAAATCTCSYVECQLLMNQIVGNRNWLAPASFPPLQSAALKSSLQKLLHQSLVLCYQFPGLSHEELACFRQLRLRALALRLLLVIGSSNQSALALCDAFLDQLDILHRYLEKHHLTPEPFVAGLWEELVGQDEPPRPGTVARMLVPRLAACPLPPLTLSPHSPIRQSTATITEPQSDSDTPLRFTAGLVLSIPLDVTLEHVPDTCKVKVKVKYPDQHVDLIVPNLNNFRPLESPGHFRLYTTVLVSHNVWSESAPIELSIVLDLREPCGGEEQLIPLCQPVRVPINPKHPRKGL